MRCNGEFQSVLDSFGDQSGSSPFQLRIIFVGSNRGLTVFFGNDDQPKDLSQKLAVVDLPYAR
jgi:hypothetical protein